MDHHLRWTSWLLFFAFLFVIPSLSSSLKCYQCLSASLEACPDDDYRECPPNQVSDRCSIGIKKSPGQFMVKRECTLGPCELRDANVGQVLNIGDKCDMSKPEMDCLVCCKGDGCNKNASYQTHPNQWLNLAIVSLCFTSFLASVAHCFILAKNTINEH
ncbi:hypothetical protein HDE_06447 [Halotydeus destructor]|nr:hypothetical protein HDE_06447 [Halotydeus destructor]